MSWPKVVFFGMSLVTLACDKGSSSSEAPKAQEPEPPNTKAIDPDLAQAVAAASAGVGANKGPAGASADGPPPNGIFAAGAADKELRLGQRPKLTFGSEGSEPRVTLLPAQPKPGARQSATLRLSVQNAPSQGALPLDLSLSFEAQKPRGDEGHVDEVPVTVRITSARLGVTGAPKELEASVGRLKGTKVEYLVLPDGSGTNYRLDASKGLDPELLDILRSLTDTLALITLSVPDQPVGVGAYWMVTSRDDAALGLDLVTYRLVKVERAEPTAVTLNVSTKRYSAKSEFDLPGLPADVPRSLVEFQALADGTLEVQPGKGFPIGGRQESALGATLGSGEPNGQRGMLEIRTRAELSLESSAR